MKKSFQELSDRKEKYDKSLISKNYNYFTYYGIFLDTLPEVLCTGGFDPEFDFEGNTLQDYMNLQDDLESFYFSLIPFEDVGLALFGWIERKGSSCIQFTINRYCARRLCLVVPIRLHRLQLLLRNLMQKPYQPWHIRKSYAKAHQRSMVTACRIRS